MVDDVDLVHAPAGQGDLVEVTVVIDAVAVHPVGTSRRIPCPSDVVDVQPSGVVSNRSVVVFARVVILDQVVPSTPFPDNFSVVCSDGFDLDDVVGPDVVLSAGTVAGNLWVAAGLECLLFTALFPRNHEDVSVGHGFDVVVRDVHDVVVGPRPFQFTLPGNAFDLAAGSAT